VNEVFTEAMDERITDMDYIPEDNLRCNVDGDFGPVDVFLVQKGEEDADKLEAQCEVAGRYIQSLISPSAESSTKEHYQYKDIVILLRTAKGTASTVVEHLKKMHIPAMYEGVPDFFGLSEVKSFLCLLTVIDNLHNDDALVGTLINTPFLFTEGELADIRIEKNEYVPFHDAFEKCAERNEKPIDAPVKARGDLGAILRSPINLSITVWLPLPFSLVTGLITRLAPPTSAQF
jgi:ATP-dependent exoDNAse (exonuclease V) beta subunit